MAEREAKEIVLRRYSKAICKEARRFRSLPIWEVWASPECWATEEMMLGEGRTEKAAWEDAAAALRARAQETPR